MTPNPRHAFIIPKPLPFMVCASIIDQLGVASSSDLLLVTTFAGADELAKQYLESDQRWGRLSAFDSLPAAYRYARKQRYDQVFIDSDVGTQKMATLLRFRLTTPSTINVYEEGVGTYRSDLYTDTKKSVLSRFGIATEFGGSPFTDNIFVYDADLYRRSVPEHASRAVQIVPHLIEFISRNIFELSTLFRVPTDFPGSANDRCNLYLTNWQVDRGFMSEFEALSGVLLLKPHPHFKKFSESDAPQKVRLVPPHLPAELLILRLAAKHSSLVVYHHGSSAAHYLSGSGPSFIRIEGS